MPTLEEFQSKTEGSISVTNMEMALIASAGRAGFNMKFLDPGKIF